MKKTKITKIIIKRDKSNSNLLSANHRPYMVYSIHGAAFVRGADSYPYLVGDRLSQTMLESVVANPQNDVIVTL